MASSCWHMAPDAHTDPTPLLNHDTVATQEHHTTATQEHHDTTHTHVRRKRMKSPSLRLAFVLTSSNTLSAQDLRTGLKEHLENVARSYTRAYARTGSRVDGIADIENTGVTAGCTAIVQDIENTGVTAGCTGVTGDTGVIGYRGHSWLYSYCTAQYSTAL